MHRISFLVASLVLTASVAAQDHSKHQQQKPREGAKHEMEHAGPWKEMNAFHAALGPIFHPAADQKNLKPLREKADALAAAARAWTASTPPAACADPAVKSTVAAISTDALALANQVLANASDADLTKAITSIHDKFESVEKKCGAHAGMKH